jgi:double-stranded uracil-DNA glycosylase
MPHIASFKPIECNSARILILGSMPGAMSLAAKQYYAHPRNSFWKIMSVILEIPEAATYEERISALQGAGIALWDVLHSCIRAGSLDANIETDSVRANDFSTFFRRHPNIDWVCFNGATAEKYFKRYVVPSLKQSLRYVRLPSTSPAHASLTFNAKVAAWRVAIHA